MSEEASSCLGSRTLGRWALLLGKHAPERVDHRGIMAPCDYVQTIPLFWVCFVWSAALQKFVAPGFFRQWPRPQNDGHVPSDISNASLPRWRCLFEDLKPSLGCTCRGLRASCSGSDIPTANCRRMRVHWQPRNRMAVDQKSSLLLTTRIRRKEDTTMATRGLRETVSRQRFLEQYHARPPSLRPPCTAQVSAPDAGCWQ